MTADKQTIGETDIAIVGMAAHLPGAADISTYWRNLRDGVSSIRRLSDADLTEAGEDPGLRRHRDYVPFAAPLDDFDLFDAEFFGFSPKEAAIMDPQHRQFLETAWEALENAGQVPENFPGQVGVFAGCGMGSYFYFNVCSNPDLVENTGMFLLRHTGNDKDFMTTRLSHVLDLHGPSINLQTACSTSLVATHYAVQALLNGECDLALAGGVTIELPQGRGYLYKENEILSPDGACHAFDHRAQGTVFGSGAGVVVLRRAVDAIADGDHIWSIIKGTAVNNDGAQKAGYLAPSVDGQATAVSEAQALADVTADTIDYVECHGTGTYLGDPIEVAALTQAFRETSDAVGHCRIGSVKTNIGHLDTAAGVASLIKASLALHHKQMPPSLGYDKPNPAIDFENSPFRVNDRLTPWQVGAHPRRAGVNSLGVGGTNAHVILEEAPERGASDTSDWPFQILTLSARSKTALDEQSRRLAEHLRTHPEQSLADVAFTLKQGRRAFDKRRIVVAETHDDAARLLIDETPRRVHSHSALNVPDLVFMFPGGGAQYAGMARDLYETEPEFAEWMDRGLAHLATLTEVDMRALWLPERGDEAAADLALQKPSLQLPLIMIVEYALAQMWMGWGLTPSALTGHSMGENTAACLAGVIGFEDCIGLVHLRGSLFDEVPAGGMLSVNLPADDLRGYLSEDLDLGAVNAPELSVASGPQAALDALEARLKAKDIECQRIAIDIAAHSRMLDPILDRFRTYLQGITLQAPQIPLTSNRTGALMTAEQATNPEYWVEHLRGTVHFADGIATLAQTDRVFLEVGPGKAMSALTRQHPDVSANQVLSSLRHPQDQIDDDKHMFEVLGRLWALGAEFDWDQIWGEGPRHRVPLPTYAFQRASYFIEPGQAVESSPQFLMRGDDIAEWGWKPVWRPRSAALEIGDISEADPQVWLMFADDGGLATRAAARLRGAGHQVIEVRPSDGFARLDDTRYVLAPEQGRMGYDQLIADLVERGLAPTRIAHFWMVTQDESHRPGSSFFHRIQEQGFYSLLFLAQALADDGSSTPHITIVTNGAAQLRDEGLPYPGKATIAGPARVIPRELPGVTVSTLDLELPQRVDAPFWKRAQAETASDQAWSRVTERVLEDLLAEPGNSIAALRTDRRFECAMKPVALPETDHHGTSGVFLITGGFGGIGLSLAEDYARAGATLILIARKPLPDRGDWADYLARHAPQDQIARRIRAVQALEEAGGTILIRAADVCNLDQMQELRTEIEAEHGRITGIIHGAGVIDDGPLLTKSPAAIEDVFTPKIHGTEILGQVFPDGAVDWMVLFASSSTVTAPAGQVDYVAANEFLNAYAKSRNGKTRVTAINWGIWNEVGMAAEAVVARSGDVPKPPVEPVDFPLLTSATFDAQGNRLFHTSFGQEDWIIDEHRTRAGDALLPGTGYLTLAGQALRAHHEEGAFEINDLTFLRPLRVTEGAARDVQIRLSRSDTGYDFDVLADATLNGRQGHALTAQASVSLLPLARPEPLDLGAIRARCDAPHSVPGQKLTAAQEVHLAFGPRWKVLDARALGQGEGIADLSLPEMALEDACILHPALLDIATGWAMELIEGYQPTHLWVPVRYGRVRVHQDLPHQVVSWVRNAAENRADAETASFDITLCGPDGVVVMEITGFTIRKLESADILRNAPQITAAEIEFGDAQEGQPLSPAEERLAHNLSQGILPREGVEAFHRALALNLPQVVVSSMDLDALTRQTAQSTSTTETQKFDRPQLDGDYVAPENEIERQLVGFWETLLGVQNVGVEDSFFDLGGHSLIAVRLFAMVKKTFRVDFPISVLFEAPTIRKCAGLIADQVGLPDETSGVDAGSETQPREPSRRFTHLVPMHDGDGGARQPFFLIAGMFGNVLNLRHLAHLLGTDRPFYGVQARGLFGGEAPHDSIEEAARDYIAEMRQVQPHGPYMIGGFSGGGISAYEIAHQLEAMGEEVSLVVMLDTPLPQRRPLSRKDRLIIQMQKAREKGVFYPVIWAKNRIAWEFEKRRQIEETHVAHGFHNAEIEAAFYRAIAKYDVRPWDGRVVLFRPPLVGTWTVSEGRMVDEDRSYVTHDNDWGLYVPGVEVHEVPGDHDSMVLEPNVRVLAALMRDAIQRAETAGEPRGQVLSFPIQAAE